MNYWLSLRKEELIKRLSLLLALVVVVTMITIVSAMPAMAKKPTSSGGGGGITSPGGRGEATESRSTRIKEETMSTTRGVWSATRATTTSSS
jgi:hypothetical protein